MNNSATAVEVWIREKNYFGAAPFRLFSNGELSVPFLAALTLSSSSRLAPSRSSHRFTHCLMMKIQICSRSCSSVRPTANKAYRGGERRFIRRVPLHRRGCAVCLSLTAPIIFLSILYVCTSANLCFLPASGDDGSSLADSSCCYF